MFGRGLRPFLAVVLIAGGAVGVVQIAALQRRADAIAASQLDVAANVATLAITATQLGAAQEAYVAPGQPREQWLARVTELSQQITRTIATIRPGFRSAGATAQLQSIDAALQDLLTVDTRIRAHLANGQDLSASDLIFTEARRAVDSTVTMLRALEPAERRAADDERASLAQQFWIGIGLVGLAWTAGLTLLLRRPREPLAAPVAAPVATAPLEAEPVVDRFRETGDADTASPSIDLAAAAVVCIDLSRLSAETELPDLLARAAAVLDASGIILWMGAGEDLFPVTAHGYDARVLARLGPISRQANNATAAAWRSGEMATVAGDGVSSGAIVAPMFGVGACIGVLTAEVRHGREDDATARAVTAMFAAQLSTIVAAWPAPSVRNAASM